MRNSVLISGANGFVGRNLVEHLVKDGAVDVVAGMREPHGNSFYSKICAHANCQAVQFDLSDRDGMRRVLEKHRPTHAINCAAYGVAPGNEDSGKAFDVNVAAALDFYKMSAEFGVRRFAQIGTCAEYGPKAGNISESFGVEPVGLYATSKAAASLLLLELAQNSSTKLLVLRLFNTWGKFEAPHRLIPSMMKSAVASQPIKLSKGTQVRDFSYAPQLVRAISDLTFLKGELPHQVFNIGTGAGISVRDFAERVADELGITQQLDVGALPMRPNELPVQIADVSRLKQVLGDNVPQPFSGEQIRDYLQAQKNMD